MNDTRARFEEIWPVPHGIGWNTDHGRYMVLGRSSLSSGIAAVEYQARLDTFTRCQETMSQKVIDAIRDVCELEPADASNPECLIVTANDLGIILSRHFEGVE